METRAFCKIDSSKGENYDRFILPVHTGLTSEGWARKLRERLDVLAGFAEVHADNIVFQCESGMGVLERVVIQVESRPQDVDNQLEHIYNAVDMIAFGAEV